MTLQQISHKLLLKIANTVRELGITTSVVFRGAKIILSCLLVCMQVRNEEFEDEGTYMHVLLTFCAIHL